MVADGRSFQVAAYRAARVRFEAGETERVETPPLSVRALPPEEMAELARTVLRELCGAEPERLPELPRPGRRAARVGRVGRGRSDGRARPRPGDLVLVDGSLHGGPLVPPVVVRRVHAEAVARGVSLAGVVKASTLYWGRNAPLVTLLKRRGDRERRTRSAGRARISTDPVFARLYVGDIFVAHLAPTAPYAFRVDVARGPAPASEVLGRLAGARRRSRLRRLPVPARARPPGGAGHRLRRGRRPALLPRRAVTARACRRTTSRCCSRTSTRC